MTTMQDTQHIIVCQHLAYGEVVYTLEALRWVPLSVRNEIEHRHFESLEIADKWAGRLNDITISELNKNKDWYEAL